DQKVEDILAKGVQQTDHGAYLSVAPDIVESMMASIKEETENMVKKNMQPVIICSPTLRRHLRKIVEQLSPLVAVLSHAELLQNITVKSVGKVMIKHGS
ncbi:MAG: EscV/YscV/HrcV family type III secretion system export apparatus protein, partial [bacterium]|nr:EscV/YscV/HrcV family type III secretion system export apparatus protein [bacterium]